ncbi:MAG: hypothetical protein JSW60_01895 [Thermoplasmatales archaeon]|nr:MAG: hypothetical protein JSW60_01895 [Thermoplasmatales archaeon]
MKQSEKLWICNDCRSIFGSPWNDSKSKKERCVICGSSDIIIQKSVSVEINVPKKQK